MSHLDELMTEVAATQRAELERLHLEAEILRRMETRAPAIRKPAGLTGHSWGLAMAGVGAAAVVAALWLGGGSRSRGQHAALPPSTEPGLAFVTSADHPGRVGDLLEGGAERPLAATFSDGSEVVVAVGARARVTALDPRGAAIALERGRLDIHVVHRAETRWRVLAGVYQVRVTGTRFSVIAPAGDDALLVRMSEGSVEVSGPTGVTSVRAGQELHAGPAGFTIDAMDAPVATPRPPSPSTETARPAAGPRDWRVLARRARYDEALAAAVAGDFGAACAELSSDDVMLLGDVARLAGDPARAEQAYSRALSRFPRLDRPAFALGVMSFEARHDYRAAGTWFERYLRAHPSGPLAAEASGRLLEALQRGGETARARAAASTYLRQYPDGAHAALARSLVAP